MGYAISEIKSRITAQGNRMTKGEELAVAWRRGYMRKDYSLIEPLLHQEYLCTDYRMGLDANFESEKALMETISPFLILGAWKIIYENDDVYVLRVFAKYNETHPRYIATMVTGVFRDGKIFRHEVVREILDYDPSEGQDWNWEDYE